MPDPRIAGLLRRTTRLATRPGPVATDAALLSGVARDGDPAAFTELLARHGPGVWAVCRRVVRTEADAEDVFQATFLVLARDAARVRKASSVASWLFGVAHRLGRKARVRLARTPDPARLAARSAPDPAAAVTWDEVRAALDEELARLPDGLRAPLLLCYYHGLTQDEAAAELGWTARTVKARVARGRAVLRARLTRRGIELPAALAVPLLAAVPGPAPARLTEPLAVAAANVARRQPPGDGVPAAAVELAHSGARAMHSFRTAVGLACAAAIATVGIAFGLRGGSAPADPQPPAPTPAPAAEPLRPGEVARIGTTQFRQTGWHHRIFFTPNPDVIVVKAEGARLRFWDVPTGKSVHDLIIPEADLGDADATPGGNLLAVTGTHWADRQSGKAHAAVWLVDTTARKVLRRLDMPGVDRAVHQSVRVSADGRRVFTAADGDLRVWDAGTGDELLRHQHRGGSDAFAVSRDGKAVAFGRYDLHLWRWDTGEEPKPFARFGGFGVEAAWFAADGRSVYVDRTGSGQLAAWDVTTGRQTGHVPLSGALSVYAVSPDGKTLALAVHRSEPKEPQGGLVVELVDAATGQAVRRLPAGRTGVSHLRWSEDGARLAAVTEYQAWVWDVKTGRVLGPVRPGHEGTITALAFAPDGTLFTASDDHTVRSWDAAGRPGPVLTAAGWVRGLALSPDGSLVAGSALRDDLRVWEAKTGRQRFRLLGNGRNGGVRVVRFTPDGGRLVAWGDDEFLRVWDMRNGRLLAEHTTRPADKKTDPDDPFGDRDRFVGMTAAAVSPDGTAFALSSGKAIRLIDPMTGVVRQTLDADLNWLGRIAFSPDGKRLAAAGRGKGIDTKLPDGRTRHSTANEHPISVWDAASGERVWEALAPGHWCSDLAFSPDGARLAEVAVVDGGPYAVRLRDAATGADAGRIDLPGRGGHLAFDGPGRRLAVSFSDTTAVVYDLATAITPPARRNP
jgi:RNA polymerase sigma factor (sigma-70 family)